MAYRSLRCTHPSAPPPIIRRTEYKRRPAARLRAITRRACRQIKLGVR